MKLYQLNKTKRIKNSRNKNNQKVNLTRMTRKKIYRNRKWVNLYKWSHSLSKFKGEKNNFSLEKGKR